jgi:hypothetical protein
MLVLTRDRDILGTGNEYTQYYEVRSSKVVHAIARVLELCSRNKILFGTTMTPDLVRTCTILHRVQETVLIGTDRTY